MSGAYEHKEKERRKHSEDDYLQEQESLEEVADDLFNMDSGDASSSEDGLPDAFYEHAFYLVPETGDVSVGAFLDHTNANHPVSSSTRQAGLEKIIAAEFKQKLAQFTEYKRKGYNTLGREQTAIRDLTAIVQETASLKRSPLQETLSAQAGNVLQFLASQPASAGPVASRKTRYQAIQLANLITTALAALNATGQLRGDWETRTHDVVGEQLNRLSGEAARRINEDGMLPVSNEHATRLRQQLEGIMFSSSRDHTAENIKFSKLRNSLLAEDRITRTRLATYLERTSGQILTGARNVMQSAMAERYGDQIQAGPAYAEWAVYSQLSAVRPEQRSRAASDGFADIMLFVSGTLKEAAVALRQQAAGLRPVEETTPDEEEDLIASAISTLKRLPKKIIEYKEELHLTGSLVVHRGRAVAGAVSPRQPVIASYSGKSAIKETALLLLDELHQAERQIKLLPSFALEVQEAVEQRQSLRTQTPASSVVPVLDALLDEQLVTEEARWRGREQQAAEKLAALVAPLVRFTQNKRAKDFYYDLANVLYSQQPVEEEELKGRAQFQTIIDGIVGELTNIAHEVDGSAVRLAGHGNAGGAELVKKAGRWLQQLKVLEAQVNAGVAQVTGVPLAYHSRGGMLARGVAEWAESLKQAYLQNVNAEEQKAESALFEQTLIKVIGEHRDHFQKDADPEAAGFLQRLSIELKNAAQHTTVYPPTPEEILAGARTVPEDIRRWAEKKVVDGAISAAIRQGFKIVSGPLSLPGRLVMRSARTGLALYRGTEAMNLGVRVGEGAATSVRNQFIRQELSKGAFRLTMSLSPLAAWGLAASITVERLNSEDSYAKEFITKSLYDLPEDLLWRAGYAGLSEVFQALFTRAVEHSDDQVGRELFIQRLELHQRPEQQEQSESHAYAPEADNSSRALGSPTAVNDTGTNREISSGINRDDESLGSSKEKAMLQMGLEENKASKRSKRATSENIESIGNNGLTTEEYKKIFVYSEVYNIQSRNEKVKENTWLLQHRLDVINKKHKRERIHVDEIDEHLDPFKSRININGVEWRIDEQGFDENAVIEPIKTLKSAGPERIYIKKNPDGKTWGIRDGLSDKYASECIDAYSNEQSDKYPEQYYEFYIDNVDVRLQEMRSFGSISFLSYLKLRFYILSALFYRNRMNTELAISLLDEKNKAREKINEILGGYYNGDELLEFVDINESQITHEVEGNTRGIESLDVINKVSAGEYSNALDEYLKYSAIARKEKLQDEKAYLNKRLKRLELHADSYHRLLKSKGYTKGAKGRYTKLLPASKSIVGSANFSINGKIVKGLEDIYQSTQDSRYNLINKIKEDIKKLNIAIEACNKESDLPKNYFILKELEGKIEQSEDHLATTEELLGNVETRIELFSRIKEKYVYELEKLIVEREHLIFRKRLFQLHSSMVSSVEKHVFKANYSERENYHDVVNARAIAVKIYHEEKGSANNHVEQSAPENQYEEIVSANDNAALEIEYIKMLVMWSISHPGEDLNSADPLLVLKNSRDKEAKYSIDLYFFDSKRPANYIDQNDIRMDFELGSRKEYTEQYNDYIDNGSARYDAETLTPSVLMLLNLSRDELINPPKSAAIYEPIYNVHSEDSSHKSLVSKRKGYISVIELSSGDYIFIDSHGLTLKAVRFTKSEVENASNLFGVDKLSPVIYNVLLDYKGVNRQNNYNTLEFVKKIHAPDLKSTVQNILELDICKAMESRKLALEKNGIPFKIASFLIPFFREAYYLTTDSHHHPDVESLVLDTAAVVQGLYSIGVNLSNITSVSAVKILEVIFKNNAAGMSRSDIVKTVVAALPKLGVNVAKASGVVITKGIYNIVEPLPVSILSAKLKKYFNLKFTPDVNAQRSFNSVRKDFYNNKNIPEKWAVNNIEINHVQAENGVFKIPQAGTSSSEGTYRFYIKSEDRVFEVKEDPDNKVWRLVNPDGAGYAPPVELNLSGEWGLKTKVGPKDGGLLDYIKNFKSPFSKSTVKTESELLLNEGVDITNKFNKGNDSALLADSTKGWLEKAFGKEIKNLSKQDIQELWIRNIVLPVESNLAIKPEKIIKFKENFPLMIRRLASKTQSSDLSKINDALSELSMAQMSKYAKSADAPEKIYNGAIRLHGNIRFNSAVENHLDTIASTPSGKILLDDLKQSGVKITPPGMNSITRSDNVSGEFYGKNSAGGDVIQFDPENRIMGNDISRIAEEPWLDRDPSVALYHELLHIYYTKHSSSFTPLKGTSVDAAKVGGGSSLMEEARIVGVSYYNKDKTKIFKFDDPDYAKNHLPEGVVPLTENDYRKELAQLKGKKFYDKRPHYGNGSNQVSLAETRITTPEKINIATMSSKPIPYDLASDIPANGYLSEMRSNKNILDAIDNPAGKCEALMSPVAQFMQSKGFTDIRYRGMYIWSNASESIPANHFVVVGKLNGNDYVFDMTAHQFEHKGMSHINAPLILPADEWAKKYNEATTTKVIYYSDFDSSSKAKNFYDAHSGHSPLDRFEGKVFIKKPKWYETHENNLSQAKLKAGSADIDGPTTSDGAGKYNKKNGKPLKSKLLKKHIKESKLKADLENINAEIVLIPAGSKYGPIDTDNVYTMLQDSGFNPKTVTFITYKSGKVIDTRQVVSVDVDGKTLFIDKNIESLSPDSLSSNTIIDPFEWRSAYKDKFGACDEIIISATSTNDPKKIRMGIKSHHELSIDDLYKVEKNLELEQISESSLKKIGGNKVVKDMISKLTPAKNISANVDLSPATKQELDDWMTGYTPIVTPSYFKAAHGDYGILEGVDGKYYINVNNKLLHFTPTDDVFKKGTVDWGKDKLEMVYLNDKWVSNKTPYAVPWANYTGMYTPNVTLRDVVKKRTFNEDYFTGKNKDYAPPPVGVNKNIDVEKISSSGSLASAKDSIVESAINSAVEKVRVKAMNKAKAEGKSQAEAEEFAEAEAELFSETETEAVSKLSFNDTHHMIKGIPALKTTNLELNYGKGVQKISESGEEIMGSLERIKENSLAFLEKLKTSAGRNDIKAYLKTGYKGLDDVEIEKMMETLGFEAKALVNRIDHHLINEGTSIITYASKTEKHRDSGTLAFVITGDEGNHVFVNLDMLLSKKGSGVNHQLDETLTHEHTHLTSSTVDAEYITSDDYGYASNLNDAIKEYKVDIVNKEVNDKVEFIRNVYGLDENNIIAASDDARIDKIYDMALAVYKKNENKLMPTLMIRNADTEAIMLRDLGAGYSPGHIFRKARGITATSDIDNAYIDFELTKALLK